MENSTSNASERPRALRPAEAAQLLRIGKTSLYRLIAEGELRIVKVGTATLIPTCELDAWIAKRLAA